MDNERHPIKRFFDDFPRPARMATAFLHVLFPSRCLRCRIFFHDASARKNPFCSVAHRLPGFFDSKQRFGDWTATFLCPDCRAALDPVEEPFCSKCGAVFSGGAGPNHLCSDCMQAPRYYGFARAAGLYTGALRVAIHRLKYSGWVHLAGPLGRWMTEQACRYWVPGDIDMVLPVPMHPRRLRKRGFNQAYLLLAPLMSWATPGCQNPGVTRSTLVRIRETRSQTGMKKLERLRNVRGVFSVRNTAAVKDKTILLVDDVLTTGATVNECARILRGAGALRVDVMTLSRAASQPASCRNM